MPSNQFSPLSRAVYKMAMRKSTVAQWYLQEAENCFLKRLFGLCWSVPEFYPKYLKKTWMCKRLKYVVTEGLNGSNIPEQNARWNWGNKFGKVPYYSIEEFAIAIAKTLEVLAYKSEEMGILWYKGWTSSVIRFVQYYWCGDETNLHSWRQGKKRKRKQRIWACKRRMEFAVRF